MKKDSNSYIFLYATVMVILVAGILSITFSTLNPFYLNNQENEKKVFILRTVIRNDIDNLKSNGKLTPKKVNELFKKHVVKSYLINTQGQKVEGDAFSVDLKAEKLKKKKEDMKFPVFIVKNDQNQQKVVIPVSGQGLWGPIWGYISFDQDGNTIYGDIFDHASETPGLGANIVEDYFQKEFFGKKIFEGGNLVSVTLVKGGAKGDYEVDAITGSTLTSDGVTNMLKSTLEFYKSFLEKKNF